MNGPRHARTPVTLPPRHPDAPAPGERIATHYGLCEGCGPAHPTGLRPVPVGPTLDIRAQVDGAAGHDDVRRVAHAVEVNP